MRYVLGLILLVAVGVHSGCGDSDAVDKETSNPGASIFEKQMEADAERESLEAAAAKESK